MKTDTTRPDVEGIKARCDAATPGKWAKVTSRDVLSAVVSIGIATIAMDFERDEDADFVVKAKNEDIPSLLTEVERLRGENERLKLGNAVQADEITRLDAELQECRELLREEIARMRECEPDALDSLWAEKAREQVESGGAS